MKVQNFKITELLTQSWERQNCFKENGKIMKENERKTNTKIQNVKIGLETKGDKITFLLNKKSLVEAQEKRRALLNGIFKKGLANAGVLAELVKI